MKPETGLATPSTFNVDGDEIRCVCDPAHLVKNLKSNFVSWHSQWILADDVVQANNLPSNQPKFSHIQQLADFQVKYFLWISALAFKKRSKINKNHFFSDFLMI